MSSTDSKGHYPTKLDKWLLVKYGKFPNQNEIPRSVSAITMRRVHDRARVHFSIGMAVVAAVGMFANALIAKYQVSHGDSLELRNKQFLEKYNQEKDKQEGKQ